VSQAGAAIVSTTPGQKLRDLRISRGWSQTVLSAKSKVSIGTISFAERDERHPQELVQERIARALSTQARPVHRRDIWP
jgi:transcriptional regulator with XRE-family HTH domain